MPTIQIGFDIPTFLSVIFPIVLIFYTQMTHATRVHQQKIGELRIAHMTKIREEMTEILMKGDKIISDFKQAEVRGTSIDKDAITNFCIEFERFIRIRTVCIFQVWATKKEREIFEKISSAVICWHQDFFDANVERNKLVPNLNDLVRQLGEAISSLSGEIRAEVDLRYLDKGWCSKPAQ